MSFKGFELFTVVDVPCRGGRATFSLWTQLDLFSAPCWFWYVF